MKTRKKHYAIAYWMCVFCSLIALKALAHDTFLLPVQKIYPVNDDAEIRMSSGLSFPEQTWGVDENRIDLAIFTLNAQAIDSPFYAKNKEYLSINLNGSESGVITAAISTKVRAGAIDNDNVDEYLDEIGATSDVKQAFHALPGNPSLQRSYVKHTKTFACVTSCDDKRNFMSTPVGQKLEFIAVSDSNSRFRLLFEGKAMSNHKVKVKNTSKETLTLMTDENGNVDLNGKMSGSVMLAAVALTLPDKPDGLYHSDQATLVLSL